VRLFYRKYGSGPPLIILHGLFGSSDNWVTIAKSLADSFTVYLPDLRNHGQSGHSDVHNYEAMSDDLFELAQELSLKKFFLAGHSMGGKTAVSFAVKWPEMLNGLLIADISPFDVIRENYPAYIEHKAILEAILSTDIRYIASRNDIETELSKKISSEKTRGLIMKNVQRTESNSFEWKLNAPALLKNLESLMKGIERKKDYYNQVTGFPVIFLKGSLSEYLTPGDFKDVLTIFPAAELIEIEGAGHWVNSDKPEEVVKSIRMLLQ
jgi:esterase